MRHLLPRAAIAAASLAALTACPPAAPVECIEGDEEVCDAGLPPDACDSQQEALDDAERCHLTVGTSPGQDVRKAGLYISTLGDGGVDQDWYFAQLPATVGARSLLHVNGGYTAPQSAVNFSINVLRALPDGGLTSIASGVDRHGAAAPRPVDLILPFTEPSARLFLLVGHEQLGSQAKVDNRNPYSMLVEVLDNPDSNEPNDVTATPIALTAGNGGLEGAQAGFLATTDDVDRFSFPVTQASRQIIYLRITGKGAHPTNPPPPYRLAYTLYDPGDRPIAEGQVDNEFLPVDLATAKVAPSTGTYRLAVYGYKAPGDLSPVRGDLRLQYGVELRLLPDLDTQEPNDSLAMARPLSMGPNTTQTITGKISAVPDEEWFRVSLPARSTPSVLRWALAVAPGGGRFPPLAPTATRQVRFLQQVTQGATAQDRQRACITSAAACPRSFADPQSNEGLLVESVCKTADPPPCLLAQRNEHPDFGNLRNVVGALPVSANAASDVFLVLRDEGKGRLKYADDRDWTLTLTWEDDADEAGRQAGPTVVSLSGATTEVSGALTYGHGRTLRHRIDRGEGIRGPEDYDAVETDRDLFQFNLSDAGEQAWQLQWVLDHGDAGSPPGDIALEFTFCAGGPGGDGGLCGGAQSRLFAYSSDRLSPWYQPPTLQYATVLVSRQVLGNATVLTVEPVACQCLSAARVAAGQFFANVVGIDRDRNEPIAYRLRQSVSMYPSSYAADGGATMSCPVSDAGCGFAR
jgi:hypothetical protein